MKIGKKIRSLLTVNRTPDWLITIIHTNFNVQTTVNRSTNWAIRRWNKSFLVVQKEVRVALCMVPSWFLAINTQACRLQLWIKQRRSVVCTNIYSFQKVKLISYFNKKENLCITHLYNANVKGHSVTMEFHSVKKNMFEIYMEKNPSHLFQLKKRTKSDEWVLFQMITPNQAISS